MEYAKGTQEQLEAASQNARLLPYGTVFISKDGPGADPDMPLGIAIVREESTLDCNYSVRFKDVSGDDFWYVSSLNLEPLA